jgi:thioredoxin reductase (NADPH)
MEHDTRYDILIVGGGPIGLACGLEARRHGLQFLILEKGCLVNSLFHYPANMTFFSTSARLEIGNIPFVSHRDKPTRAEALEYYRRVAQSGELPVRLYEEVKTIVKDDAGLFQVTTTKGNYTASHVVIATGFYDIPNKLGVPGEHLEKVSHYYKEPHPYAGAKVLVVGAANSAVDVALETYRKGAAVTMVVRGEAISDRVKYWVKPDIENRIKEGSIKAYFQSSLVAIRQHEVDIMTPGGLVTLENDFVLAMTGYQPNFGFLTAMGISLSDDERKKPYYDPATYETNVSGMYLAGVVCGGMETSKWFIENSREHASVILQAILHKQGIFQ